MNFAPDLATVTHGIQLAVAPVFLLTAVSGMIGAVAGRLDASDVEKPKAAKMYDELRRLTVCFLAGVVCFLFALVCFLTETRLATHMLNFAELPAP